MISRKIKSQLAGGSQIRKMFEEGNRLKAIYGPDKVFDFSIGNPDLEPPHEVSDALADICSNPVPGMHGYMSNSGYESTRAMIAEKRSKESGLSINPGAVCMTVGAAAAMNDVLHALLDDGDEVIVLSPFFMEYNGYIANHNGKVVIVPTDENFMPVISRIREAVTDRTKAIIINSPNNPSGVVYPASLLKELNDMLKSFNHTIQVISDEPYREIVFEKFRRIKNDSSSKGLGLGLAFCRLAVESHGGRIWIDDAPGGGARFNLTLPEAPGDAEPDAVEDGDGSWPDESAGAMP